MKRSGRYKYGSCRCSYSGYKSKEAKPFASDRQSLGFEMERFEIGGRFYHDEVLKATANKKRMAVLDLFCHFGKPSNHGGFDSKCDERLEWSAMVIFAGGFCGTAWSCDQSVT